MASAPALIVADIVDELLSIVSKTDSPASIRLAANGDGSFNFQLITLGVSEQFSTLGGVVTYLAALQTAVGAETDKSVAYGLVHSVRERRRLEQEAARIAAQLAQL